MTIREQHPINPDKDFFGFKIRTRYKFYDEKMLIKELDPDLNMYHIPDNPKLVLDIGSHIGGSALMAAKMGAEVLAFEPEEYNFETLLYNIENNGMKDKIHCFNCGVGKEGMKELVIHNRNSGIILPKNQLWKQIDTDLDRVQLVHFISIKEIFKVFKIEYCDLLKMDCENSEHDIIDELDDEMVSKIGQISLEVHGRREDMNRSLAKLSKWFNVEKNNIGKYEYICKKI